MYLPQHLKRALAQVDDQAWQAVLARHDFWQAPGHHVDAEHQDLAFHILLHEGELARELSPDQAAFAFDAVPVPPAVFDDTALAGQLRHWCGLHAARYGPGLVTKLGLYVIRAGGTLGFHVDGPVFLQGMRANLADPLLQRGLVEAQASHRTVLPLRFNPQDQFLICGWRAPLAAGELFEFSNVLPHAYFSRGPEHAVLLVTTYLEEALLPAEFSYAPAHELAS